MSHYRMFTKNQIKEIAKEVASELINKPKYVANIYGVDDNNINAINAIIPLIKGIDFELDDEDHGNDWVKIDDNYLVQWFYLSTIADTRVIENTYNLLTSLVITISQTVQEFNSNNINFMPNTYKIEILEIDENGLSHSLRTWEL